MPALPCCAARTTIRKPLNKSAAAFSGAFAATFRLEHLGMRRDVLRLSNSNLWQTLSLTALANRFRASLGQKNNEKNIKVLKTLSWQARAGCADDLAVHLLRLDASDADVGHSE